jgi:hypothetical protein
MKGFAIMAAVLALLAQQGTAAQTTAPPLNCAAGMEFYVEYNRSICRVKAFQRSASARITYVVDSNDRISYITPEDKYPYGPIWRQVGVPTLRKTAPNGAYAKADGVTTIGYDNKCYKSIRTGPINFSGWKATVATDCPGLATP